MEDIHSADISWAPRTNKIDHSKETNDTAGKSSINRSRSPSAPLPLTPQSQPQPATWTQEKSIGTEHLSSGGPQSKSSSSRPPSKTRLTATRMTSNTVDGKSSKRSSWMSSLSSRFSSQSQNQSSPNPPASSTGSKTVHTPTSSTTASRPVTPSQPAFSTPKAGPSDAVSSTPPQAKSSGSFFNALRKISSQTTTQAAKPVTTGTVVPRQTLNVDTKRDRCTLKSLEPSKLKRVGFRVDVEIAGSSSTYFSSDESGGIPAGEKAVSTKLKEKGEGEALKHPTAVKEEKEKKGTVRASGEFLGIDSSQPRSGSISSAGDPRGSFSGTQGLFDVDFTASEDEGDAEVLVDGPSTPKSANLSTSIAARPRTAENTPGVGPPKQDRPTTDPLRMYRRCCQLREAPVLKRISEQLGAMKEGVNDYPHIVRTLNLTGSRMLLADVVCLSDWLAIVPVENLLLEDANLTDEGVRHVLGSLLVTKVSDTKRRKRGKTSPSQLRQAATRKASGVIEKLTLKNNSKITSDGWRYICTFVHMSRSLKALDLSRIPLPDTAPPLRVLDTSQKREAVELADLLYQAISQRKAGSHLEELIISECDLTTVQVGKITDAMIDSNIRRIGLAGNRLDRHGIEHVARCLRVGACTDLDISGTDLRANMEILADALATDHSLWALTLSNCNLDTASLGPLFTALVALPDLRFLDLSHNRNLFSGQPSGLAQLRKYIPKLDRLKRLQLVDCSVSAAQAVGLAEIMPEVRNLCYVNLLENPQLVALASATDQAGQEEACAFYASLMTAARISRTLLALDVDVPNRSATEIVQTLARQVVAYCLRNLDVYTALNLISLDDPAGALPSVSGDPDAGIDVPELLRPFIGYIGQHPHDVHDFSADDDYIAASVGVVKALGYFLGQTESDLPQQSRSSSPTSSAAAVGSAKAKEMSKMLLASARQIRVQLQSAMERDAYGGNSIEYRRLQFLDNTLQGMVSRFEVEYPETRLIPLAGRPPSRAASIEDVDFSPNPHESRFSAPVLTTGPVFTSPFARPGTAATLPSLGSESSTSAQAIGNAFQDSRRPSETSLASRALGIEEGRMHRLGQRFRRDVMPPRGLDDHLHGTSATDSAEPEHLAALRRKLEELGGDEIRRSVVDHGLEATLRAYAEDAAQLRELERANPVDFRRLRELQREAERREGMDYGGGAAGWGS